jgi:sulfur carrier protein ThiS
MATRMTVAEKIAQRVRAVGWTVRPHPDGWLVTCPDDFQVQVHRTPSDRNAHRTVERLLNSHGFDDAERAARVKAEKERQATLLADKERAAEKIAAAQQAALARAAGPFAPTQATLEDLLAPDYPQPITFVRFEVTREIAQALLKVNTRNRPISRERVDRWIAQLRDGLPYIADDIRLGSDGENIAILEGQHRLIAIEETGIPWELNITCGLPYDIFRYLGQGKPRTAADALAIEGVKDRTVIATIVRWLYLYSLWGAKTLENNDFVPIVTIVNYHATLNAAWLTASHRDAVRVRAVLRQAPAGVAAALYLVRQVCADQYDDLLRQFVDDLVTGARLDIGDPVLGLRNRILNSRGVGVGKGTLRPQVVMALVLLAWGRRVTGRRVSVSAAGRGAGVLRNPSKMPAPIAPSGERAGEGIPA